jgi:DNA-binding response OmpR family regulator
MAESISTAGRAAVADSRFSYPPVRLRMTIKRSGLSPENVLPKLLIIEDEREMIVALRDNCEFEGFQVVVAEDGVDGLDKALSEHPDLILLDVMLPKMNGLDVCRTLRRRGVLTPIIMLTARGQEPDKVAGLELGADDYVTKPFGIRELMARVRAQLRRVSQLTPDLDRYEFDAIEIDFRRHVATQNGEPLMLSPREFEILKYLIKRRGQIVTREELLDNVWGVSRHLFTRTVDNHIAKLRQKIELQPADPKYLVTLHRVGYKFLG